MAEAPMAEAPLPTTTVTVLVQLPRHEDTRMTLRIVQWATGVVGKAAARAIIDHPRMSLVGCYCYDKNKTGSDVGDICGLPATGIKATQDIDALLAIKPDCVSYTPQLPNVDHIVQILEAGCNIVTTSHFITGSTLGEHNVARIESAAIKGGASIYGSGINPGIIHIIALVASSSCTRIDKISVLESVDATAYESAGVWQAIGFGLPVDSPEAPALAERAMPSFKEAVAMMATALEIPVEQISFATEYAAATEDVDLGYMKINEGCISGLRCCWSAQVQGRAVIELKIAWKLGSKLKPDWPVEDGWVVEIEGSPSIRCVYQPLHRDKFDPGLMTAMTVVNAIPIVCDAPPGIVTADRLPLISGAHTVKASIAT